MAKPHLIIKNKFQKRRYLYSDILTKDILLDICKKATGNSDYSVEFDNNGKILVSRIDFPELFGMSGVSPNEEYTSFKLIFLQHLKYRRHLGNLVH